jgi:hypothetical protein
LGGQLKTVFTAPHEWDNLIEEQYYEEYEGISL